MHFLDKIHKENNPFKVPENYFEQLSVSINQRLDLLENEPISLPKVNNFATPTGYFEGLSAKIFDKIDQLETQKISLDNLEKINIFKIPSDYFENLASQTNIQNIGKESDIFKIPVHYFETLSERIMANEAISPKNGKVVEVNWFRKNIKWAAAASIVFLSGFWFIQNQNVNEKDALALENISKEEIKDYLETQDLSYLEYETTTENNKNINKIVNQNDLEGLKLEKADILNHLKSEAIEVKI